MLMNAVRNYTTAFKLDRCVGSFNTINNLSNKVYVPNKTEDLKIGLFNMITGTKKHQQNMYHANIIVNLVVETVIQIKTGIMINVGASA